MYRKMKPEVIEKVRFLRSRGFSIPEISKEMNIAKSTVLRHVCDVTILPEFVLSWSAKRGGSNQRMLLKEKQYYEESKSVFSELSAKEKLLFISALYWAEGNKKDLILINSDPNMIKIYISGMRDLFNIPNERISINIRIHSDLNQAKCLDFWSNVTGIPVSDFRKTEIIEGKKNGKLYYGMCRVRLLRGGDLLKKIISVNKVICEIFSSGRMNLDM